MAHSYTQRVRDSILPLSVAGTLPEAFGEWHFTGHTEDHEEADEICQLCGKDRLRYHFEISNRLTNRDLMVGSHCILQFDVAVFEDSRRLTSDEAKKKLKELTNKMRLDSCIRALQKLALSEQNDILQNALDYYRKNKKLTPKQAFVVFWRLKQNNIDHSPSFFNISLRKDQYVEDLTKMQTNRVHYFWKALTALQKKKAIELGHTPPS